MNRERVFFGALFLFLLITRFCHLGILWDEEGYPSAAAIQMLEGKALYRDFWFDKPPLFPLAYALWGGDTGWPLRLAGALFVLLCCRLVYRFARDLWSEREGMLAAALLAFFLTFWLPGAVITLGPDLLMLAPHVLAVHLAWRGRPLWSGAAAGIALLFNTKAVFVLAVCALWQYRSLPLLLGGFAAPAAAAFAWMALSGSLQPYLQQVWQWGFLYSGSTFLEHPWKAAAVRTAGWAGFHAALVLGAVELWLRDRSPDSRKLCLWAFVSLIAVAAGWRFFPRYYFHLLPVMTLAAARGAVLLGGKPGRARIALRILLAIALLIPLARFGPRYAALAADLAAGRDHQWSDLSLNQDSREAAAIVNRTKQPGDTLLVWGYRTDIFAYTRLPAGTPFLDSQPLTGVIADRHLFDSTPTAPELAARNRLRLTATTPDYIVDGLGPLNPKLAIAAWPDLEPWLKNYEPAGRTRFCIVYRRKPAP